ncbi:hypothetical protein J437_LFUL008853 [Ladona fulva]|uniref:Breast cancer anti-estrogen resistance protein 1 n=1 Tax=Ladona fulva TaxID=123851 RepID=A0A8K0K6E6_LADFU|nr:hypothetical protein J437_LFUL008853 [Ladona fulva]
MKEGRDSTEIRRRVSLRHAAERMQITNPTTYAAVRREPVRRRYPSPRPPSGDSVDGASTSALDSYDVPRPATSIIANYDVPRSWRHPNMHQTPLATPTPPSSTPDRRDSLGSGGGDSYDVPRPHNQAAVILQQTTTQLQALQIQQQQQQPQEQQEYDVPTNRLTPSSSASSLMTADSFSSSNRSSLECSEQQRRRFGGTFPAADSHYDVPRPLPVTPVPPETSSPASLASFYDAPPPRQIIEENNMNKSNNESPMIDPKKQYVLPLELGAALETLARLQEEALTSITRLLAFVSPKWRTRQKMEERAVELSLAASRVAAALKDLLAFADAALGNAAKAADPGLAPKLKILVRALRDAEQVVREANAALTTGGWSPAFLARSEDDSPGDGPTTVTPPPDALDRLIAAARTLTEDVRRIGSFIQGNGTLLFQRTAPSTNPPTQSEWLEDYDYVNLESKESVAKQNAEIREALPDALRKSYDQLVREAEEAAIGRTSQTGDQIHSIPSKNGTSNGQEALHPDDLRVLQFYAPQSVEHVNYLTRAIDAFLLTVEHNQPPKVFLAHGKFVVLSAHKLVSIGDSVHRGVTTEMLRNRVLDCANALSKALEATVQKTKRAAMHFPSVSAVQEMVDSVVDVSHLARDLKVTLVTAATGMPLAAH